MTGFGLVGHALKMALGSNVRLRLYADALPVIDGALALARQGVTTGSTAHNRAAGAAHLASAAPIPSLLDQIVHDPQTSGGLLLAVPADAADALVERLRAEGAPGTQRIGEALSATVDAPAGIELVGDFGRYLS